MFAIARTMDEEAVLSLKNFNESLLQDIVDSEIDLDRLNLYVIRQLKYGIEHNLYKEMGFESPKEFLGYRILAHNIENIGDTAVEIAKNTLALKKMLGEKIFDEFKPIDDLCTRIIEFNLFCKTLLDTSLKALFKRDYDLANETMSRYASTGLSLEKESVDLMLRHKMAPNIAFLIRLVLSSSKKMMEYSRDIAEITLNRTVEEKSQY